jgi:Protein of unknown function (DUF1403)
MPLKPLSEITGTLFPELATSSPDSDTQTGARSTVVSLVPRHGLPMEAGMLVNDIADRIAIACPDELDGIIKDMWVECAHGRLTDNEMEILDEAARARREATRERGPQARCQAARPGPARRPGNAPARRRQRSPDRQASIERRRRLVASGPLPPPLAAPCSMPACAPTCGHKCPSPGCGGTPSSCAAAATIPGRPDAWWCCGAASIAPPRSAPRSRGTPWTTPPKPSASRSTTPCERRSPAPAASDRGAPFAAAETARLVVAQRPDAETLALWLADAVLAVRLKWPLPLPLLAGALLDPSLRTGGRRPHPGDASWPLGACAAYARAFAQASALFDALGRSAEKLVAVAPRLRAKGAGAVLETFLNEDAVAPGSRLGTMSDRGLRRLFDRLVRLGAVRELTGRSTFRLYGL